MKIVTKRVDFNELLMTQNVISASEIGIYFTRNTTSEGFQIGKRIYGVAVKSVKLWLRTHKNDRFCFTRIKAGKIYVYTNFGDKRRNE